MKLAVVVTMYNSKATIKEAISAIQRSTYKNIEIILIDDGSTDDGLNDVAGIKTLKIYRLHKNHGRVYARNYGFLKAVGDIIVNIDSDVIIRKNTLQIVVEHFKNHPEAVALTGRVSKTSKYKNFASVYKNLYMHYYFGILPRRVNFLYGSFFAIKKDAYKKVAHSSEVQIADDTSLGQALTRDGLIIHFNNHLQVNHLKQFTLPSLIQNDFIISSDWAYLFIQYKGWKQLFKQKTGYAHASKTQIVSLLITGLCGILFPLFFTNTTLLPYAVIMFIISLLLVNRAFLLFLSKQAQLFFLGAIVWMIFDYGVMLCGLTHGTIKYVFYKKPTLV